VEIAATFDATCSRSEAGVQCWGRTQDTLGVIPLPRRLNVSDPAHLVLGPSIGCVFSSGGALRCWGDNQGGLILGADKTLWRPPTDVAGIRGAVGLAIGWSYACALDRGGTAVCWGENGIGQLGKGTSPGWRTPSPVPGLSAVAGITSDGCFTFARMPDRSVRYWGGIPGLAHEGVPPQRVTPMPTPAASLSGALEIAGNCGGGCAVFPTGSLSCWERADFDHLISQPSLRSIAHVAVGRWHRCANGSDGSVQCWGRNDFGQLGDGTTRFREAPVHVNGIDGVVQLALGDVHTCARRADGSVWCWGRGDLGQRGDGWRRERETPAPTAPRTLPP
jgi:hypothetical protein